MEVAVCQEDGSECRDCTMVTSLPIDTADVPVVYECDQSYRASTIQLKRNELYLMSCEVLAWGYYC